MSLFDPDFLTRIEYLSLVSRRVFRGSLMAQRRTTQRGSGVEFADHREYSPGDDFRHLDWNLYARHNELLLKRFQEEEDLHVYLLLDCSRSMAIGSPSAFDLARQVCAALAYIAMSDLDRVAVFAFAGGILHEFPLTRGKARILSLMRFLEELTASGASTSLKELARSFVVRAPRRGMVIVLSDFYDPDGFAGGLDVLRHHQFEAHVVQFHSPRDKEPSLLGDVEVVDVESSETKRLIVTEKSLQRYRELFAGFLQRLQLYCAGHGIGCTVTQTNVAFDALVMNMMRRAGVSR